MGIPDKQTAVYVKPNSPSDPLANLSVVTDHAVPSPGEGEVLVQVKLRPINPADVFCCLLVYPAFQPKSFPAVPGMEGMGVVAAVGPGVTKLKVGQRVTSLQWPGFYTGKGMWQEYVTATESTLMPVPDDISDDAAACLAVNPVTTIGLLKVLGAVPHDEYVVITAAGSAVGKQLLALCKHRGIKTIAVVRRRAWEKELKELGATEVVVTPEEDLIARVTHITGGKGACGALDCMCGEMVSTLCKCCKIGGKVVEYGAMLDINFTLSAVDTFFRHVCVDGYWVHLDVLGMSPEEREKTVNECWELFRKGVFTTGTSTTLPLDKVLDGLKEHNTPGRPGKILLSS